MKFKRSIPYDISIRPTPNNGFIVEVGCVKVVYSNIAALINDLTEYLLKPEDVEKQYNDDIAKLGRVRIGNVPDIQVTPYGPINGTGDLGRAASQAQMERELNNYPGAVIHPDKES